MEMHLLIFSIQNTVFSTWRVKKKTRNKDCPAIPFIMLYTYITNKHIRIENSVGLKLTMTNLSNVKLCTKLVGSYIPAETTKSA